MIKTNIRGKRNITIETDSLQLKMTIQNPKVPQNITGLIIQNYKFLLEELQDNTMRFVRTGNQATHVLAKLSS